MMAEQPQLSLPQMINMAFRRALPLCLFTMAALCTVSCFDIVIRPAFEGCVQDSDCTSDLSCQVGRCENETCVFTVTEGQCAVDGNACYAEGQEEPGNLCKVCDPAQSQTALMDKECGGQGCDSLTGICAGATDDACLAYCELMDTVCVDENAAYIDQAHCLATCKGTAAWEIGDPLKDEQVNTIGCRHYHASTVADGGAAGIHCPHAGPSGGGFCGTWCENYCSLAAKNCSGAFTLDFGTFSCQEACIAMSTAGDVGDMSGNTVQCRINYLLLAGEKAAGGPDNGGPDLHCVEGSPDSTMCVGGAGPLKGLIVTEVDVYTEASFSGGARFVELFNPTVEPLSLGSYTLRWRDSDQKSLFISEDGSPLPTLSLASIGVGILEPGAYLIIGEFGVKRAPGSQALRVNVELRKGSGQGGVLLEDVSNGHEDFVDLRPENWTPIDESFTESLSRCEGQWKLTPLTAGVENDCSWGEDP